MHYFIIHSGSDYEKVKELIKEWDTDLSRFKCSVLKSTKSDWHDDARAQIRGAGKIIYVVGQSSSTNENIDWELSVAMDEGKDIYIYKIDPAYSLNKILDNSKKLSVKKGDTDGEFVFSKSRQNIFITDNESIRAKLQEDDSYISEHIDSSLQSNLDVALKQYEIFVETSEELVRRKQNVNSFYITLNSVIISVILAAFALTGELDLFGLKINTASIIICLSTMVGAVICFSWRSVLQSYADLNFSKMQIISYIETQLAYNLYDTEWQLVSRMMGNRKYKSFTRKEKNIAKLFLIFYTLLFAAGILLTII